MPQRKKKKSVSQKRSEKELVCVYMSVSECVCEYKSMSVCECVYVVDVSVLTTPRRKMIGGMPLGDYQKNLSRWEI